MILTLPDSFLLEDALEPEFVEDPELEFESPLEPDELEPDPLELEPPFEACESFDEHVLSVDAFSFNDADPLKSHADLSFP